MEFATEIERKDINEIVNSPYINWHYFFNSAVLVTGATGLIGSAIVKSLIYANEILNSNIKIFALVRNKAKAENMFGNSIEYVVQDIVEPLKIQAKIDFVIHTANSTASKSFVEEPVETISSIVQGTDNVLCFAKNKKVRSAVYLSSMEVYGKTDFDRIDPLKENDYGYVDLAEVRSSYPQGKRLAENLCVAYAKEYNVNVKVARLVQTIGAGVSYDDNRVFAQFARNIVEAKDIVMHTTGSTVRCYCYITDAVSAIFALLERGITGELYNVANEKTVCSIKEMAEMLCKRYTSSKLIFNLESSMNNYYLPTLKTVLDSSKLQQLNWRPEILLEQMFERLVENFKSLSNN